MSTQLLYQGLFQDGHYTGTFQDFQNQYSGKDAQQQLYNGVIGDGEFTGSFLEFQNLYFPTQVAATTTTATTPPPQPAVDPNSVYFAELSEDQTTRVQQDAINHDFWLEKGDSRERYYKDENGDWVGPPQVNQAAWLRTAQMVSYDAGVIKPVKVEDEEILQELNNESTRVEQGTTNEKHNIIRTNIEKRDDLVFIGDTEASVNKFWEEVNDDENAELIKKQTGEEWDRDNFYLNKKGEWVYKHPTRGDVLLDTEIGATWGVSLYNDVFKGRLDKLKNIKQALEKEQKIEETKNKDYVTQTKEQQEYDVLDNHYSHGSRIYDTTIIKGMTAQEHQLQASAKGVFNPSATEYRGTPDVEIENKDYTSSRDYWDEKHLSDLFYNKGVTDPDETSGPSDAYINACRKLGVDSLAELSRKNFIKNKDGDWFAANNGKYVKLTSDFFNDPDAINSFTTRLEEEEKVLQLHKKGVVLPNINDAKYQGTDGDITIGNTIFEVNDKYLNDLNNYNQTFDQLKIEDYYDKDVSEIEDNYYELMNEKDSMVMDNPEYDPDWDENEEREKLQEGVVGPVVLSEEKADELKNIKRRKTNKHLNEREVREVLDDYQDKKNDWISKFVSKEKNLWKKSLLTLKAIQEFAKTDLYNEDYEKRLNLNQNIDEARKNIELAQDADYQSRKEKANDEDDEGYMPSVTKSLVAKDDSESVVDFNQKYNKYGFHFTIGVGDGDWIKVTAINGDSRWFSVDHWKDKNDKTITYNMNLWMRKRAVWHETNAEGYMANIMRNFSQEEYDKTADRELFFNLTSGGNSQFSSEVRDTLDSNDMLGDFVSNKYQRIDPTKNPVEFENAVKYHIETYNIQNDPNTRASLIQEFNLDLPLHTETNFQQQQMIQHLQYDGVTYDETSAIWDKGSDTNIGLGVDIDQETIQEAIKQYAIGRYRSRNNDQDSSANDIMDTEEFETLLEEGTQEWKSLFDDYLDSISYYAPDTEVVFEKYEEDILYGPNEEGEEGTIKHRKGDYTGNYEVKEIEGQSKRYINRDLVGTDDKIKEHPIYSMILSSIKSEGKVDYLTKKIETVANDMTGGRLQLNQFAQHGLEADFQAGLSKLEEGKKVIVNQIELVTQQRDVINGDGETYGLEYEANWLAENTKSIEDKILKIHNRTFTNQEDVERANFEIQELLREYKIHADNYNNLKSDAEALSKASQNLQGDIKDAIETEEELAVFANILGRDYRWSTRQWDTISNEVIDLAQGLLTVAEGALMVVNFKSTLALKGLNLLVDSGYITNPTLVSGITGLHDGLAGRWDNDPETTSWSQKVHQAIDRQQEEWTVNRNMAPPVAYGDIKDFGDFLSWGGNALIGQAPQLALMIYTGGGSALLQGGMKGTLQYLGSTPGMTMMAMGGGRKFMGMEEQKRLFYETNGAYGQDFDMTQMLFTSSMVGLTETLSERVTFGQLGKVSKYIKTGPPGVKNSYYKWMRENVFNMKDLWESGKEFGLDLLQEGGSEVLATISENVLDRANGDKSVGFFDNVNESFITGALLSSVIKTPQLYALARAPFTSQTDEAVLHSNSQQIQDITARLAQDNTLDEKTKKELSDKVNSLLNDSKQRIENSIKRVDLYTDSEKKKLVDLDTENRKIKEEWNNVLNDKTKTDSQKETELDAIKKRFIANENAKQTILDMYPPDVVNHKYNEMMKGLNMRKAEFEQAGDLKIDVTEGGNNDFAIWQAESSGHYNIIYKENTKGKKERDKLIEKHQGIINDKKSSKRQVEDSKKKIKQIQQAGQIIDNILLTEGGKIYETEKWKEVLNDPTSTQKEKTIAEENLKVLAQDGPIRMSEQQWNNIQISKTSYGAMVPVLDAKTGEVLSYKMFINKSQVIKDGKFGTAAHELLHGLLYQTLKQDIGTQEALTSTILNSLESKGVKIPQKLMDKINSYSREEGRAEEILTVLSEGIRDGDIKLPGAALDKFKNFFNVWSQSNTTGTDISFDTDKDVIDFLKTYTSSMSNNKENKSLARMFQNGVSGKLIEKAQRHRDLRNKFKPTKGQMNFSKNVDQELKNNPDLLTETDAFVKNEDGTPKYTDKNTWTTSTDFADAYMFVTQSKKLDGIIQAGMVAEGVNTPQALGDFTRKVKDELGERLLKNFDPAKNDSLFGWLTGVSGGMGKSIIYRAKGDVMNQYSKEIKAVSIDRGVTTTEGDTFSSQIEGDPDIDTQRLDEEIITIGKETVKKSDIDVVYLQSVNTSPKVVKSIDNIVENSGVNLEGLTYNGTKKNLVKHDGSKPKSKRKPTGPLYKVLDIVSNEFGVDASRIIKEQDLTNTQRSLAREYINEHADKLIDMLPEGENRSGDATGVANTVLGEFYTKGERISMAESGTGKGKVSQTKRDDITKEEFVEFFNKPGTKSDGAIRALITQAATISANQAIRLNAMKKESNPISTIALVGDGKSAIMFSKAPAARTLETIESKSFQKLGSFDNRLDTQEKRNELWNRLDALSGHIAFGGKEMGLIKDGIFEGDIKTVKHALTEIYGDIFTESEIGSLSSIINEILSAKALKVGKSTKKTMELGEIQSAILQRLHESSADNNTKVKSFFNTNKDTTEIWKNKYGEVDKGRAAIHRYIMERAEEIKKKHPNNDARAGREIMEMLTQQATQHVTAGKIGDGRNQLFAGTAGWVLDIASGIPGLNFKVGVAKNGNVSIDMNSITYNSKSNATRGSDNLILSTNPKTRAKSIFTKLDPNIEGTPIEQDIEISKDGKEKIVTKWKDYAQTGKATILDFIFNPSKITERIADAKKARKELNNFVKWVTGEYKAGRMTEVDMQLHASTLLSNMAPTLARAAVPKWIAPSLLPKGYNNMSKKQIEAHLKKHGAVYEHMQPRVNMVIHLFNAHLNEGGVKNVDKFFERYNVAIIPTKMDNVLKTAKLNSALFSGQEMTMEEWIRYYNSDTQAFSKDQIIDGKLHGMDSLIDIETGDVLVESEAYIKTSELLSIKRNDNMMLSKAVNQANTINENTPSRGMSAFDFDDTLATTKSNVLFTKPDGTKGKLNAEQYAKNYVALAEQGYEFDFSEFNKVVDGKTGPLMEKLRNRIKKFGIENNYVLTARPPAAEQAIQAWLKQQGIDMPLENITGLGNSTGEAKARWMVEKFAEGYNDMYFVDDSLPNVKAVANVLQQLDIKGSSVQAKIQFSKNINPTINTILDSNAQTELDFNRIIEQTKGVKAEARYSEAQAKVRGSKKGKWSFWVPPSAEDFKGLIYRFIGKGRQGEQQMAFFKKALFDPFSRAYEAMNASKQRLQDEYRSLLKEFPQVKKSLKQIVGDTNFSTQQAIRVYLWNKAGFEIPGLSKRDLNTLVKAVEADADLMAFANSLGIVSNQEAGYTEPGDYWTVEGIQSDITTINNEISRAEHLAEWKQNIEAMFGTWGPDGDLVGPNMNKIESIYGTRFREALEDIVWRMEFGRKREAGRNRLVNAFNNWANQSVGAIMFFNMRSALLQTISSINYINWTDNNPLKAGMAFANQKQFWKDFTMIFNSDMLKQRRAGNQRGINEAELAKAVDGVGPANRAKAILHYLLTKGFLPTQIADSFAIASGGATFYRNRVNSYLKQGLTQQEAEARAWNDFQENTEESQQSARPDMISQQQASPLGRYILAFKNTPMQYARLIKKSWLDIANSRGDFKTNLSKIIYYGAVQSLIFSALQTALGAMIGDEEEDDIVTWKRILNSMGDNLLGGLGFGGNAVATLKNTILEYNKQEGKGWGADHTYTILKFFSFSPTVGSKGRKVYSAIQEHKYNKDVIEKMGLLDIDNPSYAVWANLTSALTNIPLDRLVKKVNNVDAALTEDITAAQRFALLMGWNTWDLGIDDSDVLAIEDEIKEDKQRDKDEKKKRKKEEKKKEQEAENKIKEEENRAKKDSGCIAISKSGERCKREAIKNGYCTVHEKVEQNTSGEKKQCKKIKSDNTRCKMQTSSKSGYCYYHD